MYTIIILSLSTYKQIYIPHHSLYRESLGVYGPAVISPTVLNSSSELNCQVGDWTLGICALRFTSNGRYVSGDHLLLAKV